MYTCAKTGVMETSLLVTYTTCYFLASLGRCGRITAFAADRIRQDAQKENRLPFIEVSMHLLALVTSKRCRASKHVSLNATITSASLPDALLEAFGGLDGKKDGESVGMALPGLRRA